MGGEAVLEGAATELTDELRVVIGGSNDAAVSDADDRPEVEAAVLLERTGESTRVEALETDERGEMRPPR